MQLITASIAPPVPTLSSTQAIAAIRTASEVSVQHAYVVNRDHTTLVGVFVNAQPSTRLGACVHAVEKVLSALAGPDHVVRADVGDLSQRPGGT